MANYPFDDGELTAAYQYVREEMAETEKLSELARYLEIYPLLAPLCTRPQKQFQPAGSVPEIILAICRAVENGTDLGDAGRHRPEIWAENAVDLLELADNEINFTMLAERYAEKEILDFIRRALTELKLSGKKYRQILSSLLTWGIELGFYRLAAHEDEYRELPYGAIREPKDFDPDNLRVLQMHVKLRGWRCSVDILVREDSTFYALHYFLFQVFKREEEHLFHFDCGGGFRAISPDDDARGGEHYAHECYVGHHLAPGIKGFYLFDYGDCWEHDITVKKILPADPEAVYPQLLKVTGEIPEQYPDYDEEDEDGEW